MLRTFVSIGTVIILFTGCLHTQIQNHDIATDVPRVYFTGTIIEIDGDTAIVDETKGKVFVDLSVNKTETFHVWDNIRVEYTGIMTNSSPAYITTISVEVIGKKNGALDH